jgi:hypothetical protein
LSSSSPGAGAAAVVTAAITTSLAGALPMDLARFPLRAINVPPFVVRFAGWMQTLDGLLRTWKTRYVDVNSLFWILIIASGTVLNDEINR